MIKSRELGITLDTIKNTVSFGYGEFKLTDSFITNFDARKPDGTIDEEKAQKVLDMFIAKAFSIVKHNIDSNKLLTMATSFDDFNDEIKEGIILTTIAQLEGMLGDSPFEIKNGSSYSGQGSEAVTDMSSFITTYDRVYKSAQTKWIEYGLNEIFFDLDENGNIIIVDDRPVFQFKFETGQIVNMIALLGHGHEILTKEEIQKTISLAISSGAKPRGKWNAASIEEAANISRIFLATGIPLTNGETLTVHNTHVGDTIIVEVPSDPLLTPETAGFDGLAWFASTRNNAIQKALNEHKVLIDGLENDKVEKSDMAQKIVINDGEEIDVLGTTEKFIAQSHLQYQMNKISGSINDLATRLQTQITDNRHDINDLQLQADKNSNGVGDWLNTKGDLVLTEDLVSSIVVAIQTADQTYTKVNDNLELDLANVYTTGFKENNIVRIKNTHGSNIIYIEDNFKSGNGTPQKIVVNGVTENITVTITDVKIVITGMSAASLTYWKDNYKAILIEQLATTTSTGIDQAARQKNVEQDTIIATKQDKHDESLLTDSKTVSGGINENKANLDTTTQAVNDLNETKLSDGRKLEELDLSVDADNVIIRKTLDADIADLIANKLPKWVTGKIETDINLSKGRWTDETDINKNKKKLLTLKIYLPSSAGIDGWVFKNKSLNREFSILTFAYMLGENKALLGFNTNGEYIYNLAGVYFVQTIYTYDENAGNR